MTVPYFSQQTLAFLSALAQNNNRDWFLAHKAQFERDARDPALRLLTDLKAPMLTLSPEFVPDARATGGSLFRIHRDARFSHDKTPYKTHLGLRIQHTLGRQQPAPVFYLHIEPQRCFVGGGLWQPESKLLGQVRDFIVANPSSWQEAQHRALLNGFRMGGASLTRPPRGYPPDHPLLDDLKRKDFIAIGTLGDDEILSAELPALIISRFEAISPLMDWLCAAVELAY